MQILQILPSFSQFNFSVTLIRLVLFVNFTTMVANSRMCYKRWYNCAILWSEGKNNKESKSINIESSVSMEVHQLTPK